MFYYVTLRAERAKLRSVSGLRFRARSVGMALSVEGVEARACAGRECEGVEPCDLEDSA